MQEFLKDNLVKLALPMAIIVAAVVLGAVFYAVQYNKQQSIEKQQLLKLQQDREQQSLENKRAELKLKQEECSSLSSGVKQKWKNAVGVTYDSGDDYLIGGGCVVTYTDTKTGGIKTSPLQFMEDVK